MTIEEEIWELWRELRMTALRSDIYEEMKQWSIVFARDDLYSTGIFFAVDGKKSLFKSQKRLADIVRRRLAEALISDYPYIRELGRLIAEESNDC